MSRFYVHNLYSIGNKMNAHGPLGSVTTDPVRAFQNDQRNWEKEWVEKYPHYGPPKRAGRLYAAWMLPGKMSRREARHYASTRQPYRVYVLLSQHDWSRVELILPPGQLIDFYLDDTGEPA
jgi:hypothetical protein